MANLSLKSQLENIGFSSNDAVVYVTLLETGTTGAGEIIKRSRLHRNIVYTSLQHLVDRKLIFEKTIKGKKVFGLGSPKILSQEFEKKSKIAKDISETVDKLLPKNLEEISIHQGNEEYLDLLATIIKQMPGGSTKYVLGTGGENFMAATMRPIWKEYHQVANKQGISIKMIGYQSQRKSIESDVAKEKIYSVRFLPDKLENPGGIHIYPEAETVLNIIYSDQQQPVTAIKIKNRYLVQGYLILFNNLWKDARP